MLESGGVSTCIRGTCKTPVGNNPFATRQFPLSHKAKCPGGDGYVGRRALIGDLYGNEKRGDGLYVTMIRQPCFGIAPCQRSSTHLDLRDDYGDDTPNLTTGGP